MFELFVAFRYLLSQRKVRAIFSTALISVLGIGVGVFSLNVVLAVMSGFQTELGKSILSASAHVLVSSYEGDIENHSEVEKQIKLIPGVERVFPVVYGTGLIVSGYGSQGTTATGIDPDVYMKDFPFVSERPERKTDVFSVLSERTSSGLPPIVLGYALADALGVEKGDSVTFLFPDKEKALKKRPRNGSFEVAGIFKYGMAHYDSTFSYMNLYNALEFFGNKSPSSFEVMIEEPFQSELSAQKLEDALGFPFVAKSWQEANSKLFSALRLEKLGLTVLLGFIVLMASLSVMSVLLLMMIEKSRDIAILRVAGASRKQIGNIFLIVGSLLGFAGIVFGTAAAFTVCWLLANNETVASLIPFDPEVYGISKFPVIIEPLYFLVVAASGQLFCFFASLYPAYCLRGGNLAAKLKAQ